MSRKNDGYIRLAGDPSSAFASFMSNAQSHVYEQRCTLNLSTAALLSFIITDSQFVEIVFTLIMHDNKKYV